MPEQSLTIQSYQCINIRVEPTSLRAEGGPEYPRLIFPARLDLNPIGRGEKEQHFVILNIRCGLFLESHSLKIADAINNFNPQKVRFVGESVTHNIEFPLDPYRVEKIEKHRRGDLNITVDFHFTTSLCKIQNTQRSERQVTTEFLTTDFDNQSAQLVLEVPQSHWVEKVLPSLGYLEYFLVEVPKGKKVIQAAWEYLQKAENAFARWDTKGVFAHCREIGVLLDRIIKDKYKADKFTYAEKWSRAYKQFNHFASLDLHLENIKRSTKYPSVDVKVHKPDTEHLLIGTKSLIKYAEELLQEVE